MTDPTPLRIDRAGSVAILTIDNPPINAISAAVRGALAAALDALEPDAAIAAVVIAAAGALFSGGGDLRELGRPDAPGTVSLTALNARIERFAKPVVVALQGRAIGGGVLLALACHARIAECDATLALPELRLGFVPGAGGTQRLARLIGIEAALDMVLSAHPLAADAALAVGLVDALASPLLPAACARAAAIAAGACPWRRTADLAVWSPADGDRERLRTAAVARAEARFPGRDAPLRAIELILDATRRPFPDGLAAERQVFETLRDGPQARALLHLFFAERAAAHATALADGGDGAGSLEVVPSGKRLVELVCRGPVDPTRLAEAVAYWRAAGKLPIPVRGGSVAARLRAAMEDVADPAATRAALVAAAVACRDQGATARPADIDLIAVEACGFPALLGGPLYLAEASDA